MSDFALQDAMSRMNQRFLYLGIDFGTSGCRACVIDEQGRIEACASSSLPTSQRGAERSEQHPDDWWQALMRVCRELSGRLDTRRIRRLGLDATSATLLATDRRGNPLAPALMYDDRRSLNEARRIAATAPVQSAAHGAASSLAKRLWLQGRWPDALFMHQADWIIARLTGRFGITDENNALKMGYDPVNRRWPDWLQELGIAPASLPRVLVPGEAVAGLAKEAAGALHLPAGITVTAATTDSTAAFIATGARRPGDAVTSLGSTLVMKILSDRPLFAPEYGVYSHRLGERWLVGGASNSGGRVLLQHFPRERLEEMSARLRPDRPTCLEYYPLPGTGERFPLSDPHLRPKMTPRPRDDLRFFQALLEGMARIEARAYGLLHELGAPPVRTVRSVGGGAANAAWRRIRERILKVPVTLPAHGEAAYGAALLARDGEP